MKKGMIFFAVAAFLVLIAPAHADVGKALNASISNYDPLPAQQGSDLNVWISIQNLGPEDARNVRVAFVDTGVFKLKSASDALVTIPVIGGFNDYLIQYRLSVADDAPVGTNYIVINFSAGNQLGVTYEKRLKIEVKAEQNLLSITDVKLEPDMISPGSSSQLTLTLKNFGQSTIIRDLTATLELDTVLGTTTVLSDLPFVPVDSSTQKSVGRISPGESVSITYLLAAYPDASANIYKVPITLTYHDDNDNEYTKTILVGVTVNAKPDLLVTVESAGFNKKVSEGEVLFNIVNRGVNDVKLMTVTLLPSEGYEVTSPYTDLYIGNIDSDDNEAAAFDVKVGGGDEVEFKVKISYKDSLNQQFEETYDLRYMLRNPPNGGGGTVTVVFAIIIVLVIGYLLLKRKKRA